MARVRTSYKKTSSAQITKKSGILTRVSVSTDGTNNVTVNLYDVDSAADIADDNQIDGITVVGSNYYGGFTWPHPVPFTRGLYVTISGANGWYTVEYKRG